MNNALESKLKKYFGDMLVYKSSGNAKFFSALSLPSFMRDWLVRRFSDEDGHIDTAEMSNYIKKILPKEEQWNEHMVNILRQLLCFLKNQQIWLVNFGRQCNSRKNVL